MRNPLLDFSGLPRFAEIVPAHVGAAVDALIAEVRACVDNVTDSGTLLSWDTFVEPLAHALDRLDRAWGQVAHLNAVVNTAELREAYQANLPKITSLHTDLAQDERVFSRYRALAASKAFASLQPAQRRMIDNTLRDFRLAGVDKDDATRKRIKELRDELVVIGQEFDRNIRTDLRTVTVASAEEADVAAILPFPPRMSVECPDSS